MPASKYKPVTLRALTGIFDNRSPVDETPPGAFRWKQNFGINKDGKLARAKGWRQLGDVLCPGNADWHDQGVDFADREPITALFPSTQSDSTRRLFGSTKSRIIVHDEQAGDWTVLESGLAAADGTDSLTQARFMIAELQDKVFFTNNIDRPRYVDLTAIGAPTAYGDDAGEDDDGSPVDLEAARVVIAWNDVIFYMNTLEGGVRRHNRIRWSDLKDGTKLIIEENSIADYQDLDYGHVILNAIPIGAYLYVFTDRSIWRCSFTTTTDVVDSVPVTDAALDAVRVYYEPKTKARCLAYPNTLISDGDTAWYMGRDGIYAFRPGYTAKPELYEWLHRSTSIIFNSESDIAIDPAACNSPVAEFRDDTHELHFSWPIYDPLAEEVPPDPATIDCDTYEPTVPMLGRGVNEHTLVANVKFETADYRDYGSTAMVNFTSDLELSGECLQAAKFISANGQDWALKELEHGYARALWTVDDQTISVEPSEIGYHSIVRGVFPFQQFDLEKEVAMFLAGVVPEDPEDDAVLRLRIGTSDVALDPNGANGRCQVLFHQLSNKPIKCHYTRSAAAYLAQNVRPEDPVEWHFYYRGRFLYYELTIAAADNSAPKTGGLSLSRFEVSARAL